MGITSSYSSGNIFTVTDATPGTGGNTGTTLNPPESVTLFGFGEFNRRLGRHHLGHHLRLLVGKHLRYPSRLATNIATAINANSTLARDFGRYGQFQQQRGYLHRAHDRDEWKQHRLQRDFFFGLTLEWLGTSAAAPRERARCNRIPTPPSMGLASPAPVAPILLFTRRGRRAPRAPQALSPTTISTPRDARARSVGLLGLQHGRHGYNFSRPLLRRHTSSVHTGQRYYVQAWFF